MLDSERMYYSAAEQKRKQIQALLDAKAAADAADAGEGAGEGDESEGEGGSKSNDDGEPEGGDSGELGGDADQDLGGDDLDFDGLPDNDVPDPKSMTDFQVQRAIEEYRRCVRLHKVTDCY